MSLQGILLFLLAKSVCLSLFPFFQTCLCKHGNKIAQTINIPTLVIELKFCFILTETTVQIEESVRGRDVYIIQTGTK